MFALCDSVTGYFLKIKIYTGRDITFDKTLPYNYFIVMDLTSPNYVCNNNSIHRQLLYST